MQSVLQYRRFRRNLQKQIDSYGLERVASIVSIHPGNLPPSPQRLSRLIPALQAIPDISDRDFEEKDLDSDDTESSNSNSSGTLTRESSQQESRHAVSPEAARQPTEEDTRRLSGVTDPGIDLEAAPVTAVSTRLQQMPTRSTYMGDNVGSGPVTAVSTRLHQMGTRTTYQGSTPVTAVSTRLQQTGTRLGRLMTGVSVKSRFRRDNARNKEHYFVVGYQGPDDPLNPHNWSTAKRLTCTFLVAAIGYIVGLASSIDSASADQFAEQYGVSEVAESLATGLYLIGFGCGAFFAAPFSETVGRNPVYLFTGVMYMIFVLASALAPNIGAQIAFRFLAGFFGSTPLTCAGGSISDLWTPLERTMAFPVFALSAFIGPVLGPLVGGWIGQSYLPPAWTDWITLIWSGLIFGVVFLFLPETYAPVLLKWKAEHLRKLTSDERYMSALEVDEVRFKDRLVHNLYKPWVLIFSEPIVMLFTLYLTVVYIILFTFLTGFEFIFLETYGISQGLTFTIFVALAIGFILCTAMAPWVVSKYRRNLEEAEKQGKSGLAPEQRLIYAMIGCPFLPIGLFWMAWTSYPSISIWSPIVACVPVGFGILCIFITTYQYLIDAFEVHAASALVGITFIRYVAAGGMLPVSIPFYKNLGIHWTLTVLGAIAAVMVPVPYLFFIYGEKIRGKSRFAVGSAARVM